MYKNKIFLEILFETERFREFNSILALKGNYNKAKSSSGAQKQKIQPAEFSSIRSKVNSVQEACAK